MTTPVIPGADPSRAKLQALALQMQKFAPLKSDPEVGEDVRRLMRLLQIQYNDEALRVADERLAVTARERKKLGAGLSGAAFIGATETGTALAGGKAGALGGAALGAKIGTGIGGLPGTAIGTAVGGAVGGLVGGFAGWMAGQPLIRAAGVATQEQLDATLEGDIAQLTRLGAGVATSGIASGAVLMRNKLALSTARATTERANAGVAESIANSNNRAAQADAARKELELADMQRRMAHPDRAAASTAKYNSIQADATKRMAEAKTAEWNTVLAEQKALGQLTPAQKLQAELMGRQLIRTDLSIEIMKQNLALGSLKPAQAQKALERITTQIRVLENTATRGRAQAGVAAEEFAERLVILKNQSRLIQEKMLEMGLTPAVAGTSSLAARIGQGVP